MKSYRTKALWVTICIATLSCSCWRKQKPAGDTDQKKQADGKWVSSYRTEASLKQGAYLSLFSYNAISIVSPQVMFVAADYPDPNSDERVGLILRTTDGGTSWKELSLANSGEKPTAMNGVQFLNPTTGWAIGIDVNSNGLVFRTTDAGETWSAQKLAVKEAPTSIHFADADHGWMVGSNPAPAGDEYTQGGPTDVLTTSDGGKTWSKVYHLPVSINDMDFVDSQNAWICGIPASIYHTSDGGRTWDSEKTGLELDRGFIGIEPESESPFKPVSLSLGSQGTAAAKTPQPGNSPNPGNSQKPQQKAGKTGGQMVFSILSISFPDLMHGFAVAQSQGLQRSVVITTSDGGHTWSPLWIAQNQMLRAVHFVSAAEGWVTMEDSDYIYRTDNDGKAWNVEKVEFEQKEPLYHLASSDPKHIWAVGGGSIFRRVSQ